MAETKDSNQTASNLLNEIRGTCSNITCDKLLERAYDIRKFEIELSWKRATYFWGFQIATFAGYFIVSDSQKFQADSIQRLLVVCIGFVFAFSWYFVNRSSLYWQSTWERKVEAIEDALGMEFYKISVGHNQGNFFVKPAAFAVSTINIIVSLFICLTWVVLLVLYFLYPVNTLSADHDLDIAKVIIVIFTGICSFFIWFWSKPKQNRLTGKFTKDSQSINIKLMD